MEQGTLRINTSSYRELKMADPRFKCQVAKQNTQSSFRNFTSAISKVGDLNVLNSVGGGHIGAGLRTLVSASNSIRTGCGSLPTSVGSSLSAGSDWVMNTVGIPPSMVAAVNNINPQAANLAQGQAQQIYNKVKQGHFKLSDIPGSLSDFQNLERLGRAIYPSSATGTATSVNCLTSPYAVDLVARAPKSKFIFIVQFVFNPGYEDLSEFDFAFVVKKSSRPNTKYVMEDVNYYNFRTKVQTKTEFEEMSMSFHDDMQNNAMNFMVAYRNAMSPITNMDDNTFFTSPEQGGMDFNTDTILGSLNPAISGLASNHYSASRGPLINDNATVIREIKLYHIYNYGQTANIYQFMNPRISSLEVDEVDMAVGTEGNEVTMKFNYDNVYMQTNVDVMDTSAGVTSADGLFVGQGGAQYPLRNITSPGALAAAQTASAKAGPTHQPPNCDAPSSINTSIK
jgi:hypothetical protein